MLIWTKMLANIISNFMGPSFVARRRVAQPAQCKFRAAQPGARSVWQFGRPLCADMGVAARQGEVSHIYHGAVKVSCENAPPRVRQKLATSNLVYSRRKARAAGAVEVWLTGAQCAHVTKTSQAGFHSFRHISMQ